MNSHPDSYCSFNRTSWAGYYERLEHPFHYRLTTDRFAQPPQYAIQRQIQKLGLKALPQYPQGPKPVKNSELIPINQITPSDSFSRPNQ